MPGDPAVSSLQQEELVDGGWRWWQKQQPMNVCRARKCISHQPNTNRHFPWRSETYGALQGALII